MNWPSNLDATPVPSDVEVVAATLEGQHGTLAADVADFLSAVHDQTGDAGRCWAWAGVAERVRKRAQERMRQDR
jgi:hypothetical protein